MSYFQKALGAVFAATMSLIAASPAWAVGMYQGTNTTLTVGNYLITNISCAATGTVSCAVASWGVDPNSLASATPGDIAITIVPNATWVGGGTGSDLRVNFVIQTLVGGVVTPTVNGIGSFGTAVTGTGSPSLQADGIHVSTTSNSGPWLPGTQLGVLTGPYSATDPSAPSNRISFSPQTVVYVAIDAQPYTSGVQLTSVSFFVGHVPEPGSLGLLLASGLMLAGLRRKLS